MAKKLVKISSDLPGIHDLRTQGNIPHPTTSPFVRLHQLQKTKERDLKEVRRLTRRLEQINKQIPAIEQELERLFEVTEKEVRPSVASKEAGGAAAKATASEEKTTSRGTVVEY